MKSTSPAPLDPGALSLNEVTWTKETIAARRKSGDSLIRSVYWFVSYDTSSERPGARFCCYRLAPGSWDVVERDVRHDEIFPTVEDAEVYALNAGRLGWYQDYKRERAARGGAQ
jgi:hypothetical protein